MDVDSLKHSFTQERNIPAAGINDLRDYASSLYVCNVITLPEFRKLIRDLEAEGATVPELVKEQQT